MPETFEAFDGRGVKINVGDTVVYPGRSGSSGAQNTISTVAALEVRPISPGFSATHVMVRARRQGVVQYGSFRATDPDARTSLVSPGSCLVVSLPPV